MYFHNFRIKIDSSRRRLPLYPHYLELTSEPDKTAIFRRARRHFDQIGLRSLEIPVLFLCNGILEGEADSSNLLADPIKFHPSGTEASLRFPPPTCLNFPSDWLHVYCRYCSSFIPAGYDLLWSDRCSFDRQHLMHQYLGQQHPIPVS